MIKDFCVLLISFIFCFKHQGLNLDDCCTTYDQIERSQAQGPYEDVGITEEAEEIQLEKPWGTEKEGSWVFSRAWIC